MCSFSLNAQGQNNEKEINPWLTTRCFVQVTNLLEKTPDPDYKLAVVLCDPESGTVRLILNPNLFISW